MQHFSFPSINQFRQVVKNVKSSADYHGVSYPVVEYEVSVKIHGTNAGICRPVVGTEYDVYFQSRERIVTIESDNAGFALYGEANRTLFNSIIDRVVEQTGEKEGTVQIFGEWFGGNIQKGVGVSGCAKSLCVFGIRISNSSDSREWLSKEQIVQIFAGTGIRTKYDFPHWIVEVDFNRPELSQNTFVNLCAQVEKECPVARMLKPDSTEELVGEGIVCVPIIDNTTPNFLKGNNFKVKGDKHSVTKVKTTARLDPEKMVSHQEFIDKTLTLNRMNQGVDKMRELGHPMDITTTGHFIKWVAYDIFKEEADTMVASLIEQKDVMDIIASTAKKYWFDVVC